MEDEDERNFLVSSFSSHEDLALSDCGGATGSSSMCEERRLCSSSKLRRTTRFASSSANLTRPSIDEDFSRRSSRRRNSGVELDVRTRGIEVGVK